MKLCKTNNIKTAKAYQEFFGFIVLSYLTVQPNSKFNFQERSCLTKL